MSAPPGGFRLGFATVLAAIRDAGSLATAALNGGLSAADFAKLATAPTAQSLVFGLPSPVIDLKTTGVTNLLPPMPFRLYQQVLVFEAKAKTAATVSPTFSIGTNSPNFNDVAASQAVATLISQAVETAAGITRVGPVPFADLTASGLNLNITAGATATVLDAKVMVWGLLLPV